MILLVLIALKGISQTSSASDTGLVCIPAYQLRSAAKVIDSFYIMKKEKYLVEMQYSALMERFNIKLDIIKEYEVQKVAQKKIETNLDFQVSNLSSQKGLIQIQSNGYKSDLKRQKNITRTVGGTAIVAVGTLLYLLIKK